MCLYKADDDMRAHVQRYGGDIALLSENKALMNAMWTDYTVALMVTLLHAKGGDKVAVRDGMKALKNACPENLGPLVLPKALQTKVDTSLGFGIKIK